ncbi:MAG: GlcG/HbpS family heme-binding protein [bacterium]|jgi:uncharacterized protein GlcG (DUF336 family)
MKMFKKWACSILLGALVGTFSSSAFAEPPMTVQMKALSAGLAGEMATAALAECDRRGYLVSVAVVNRDGNLTAFLRHPLASPMTIDVSQGKAYAAANLRASTGEVSDASGLMHAPKVILVRGGLPVDVAGNFYGGIGVSGADSATDEMCARVGIDAIRETLEFGE